MNKQGKKGIINAISNKNLKHMLDIFGVDGAAKKLGVTRYGLYKNIKKRGGVKSVTWVFPE